MCRMTKARNNQSKPSVKQTFSGDSERKKERKKNYVHPELAEIND